MEKKNRVILSSFGDLFFGKTLRLLNKDIEISYIQGYVPSITMVKLLKSRLFGGRTASRLCNRFMQDLKQSIYSTGIIELISEAILRLPISEKSGIQAFFHKIYGKKSTKFIKDADIFQVRSGSGRGGAIKIAKARGMITVADHSIAHPFEMNEILRPEYLKYGVKFNIDPYKPFWKGVLQDCNDADYILVNSDYVKNTFIKFGYKKEKIKVIYLGVSDNFLGVKNRYKIKNEARILFVGEFGFRKGGEYILKALDLLNKSEFKYKLIIIGPTKGFKKILNNYKDLNIDIIGSVSYDALVNYYKESDIFLFPSLCEGGTRAGMEAMAAGLPILVTDNCGLPVTNGENGIIVPIKDHIAIFEQLKRLIASEELRTKIGINATDTIREKYMVKNYKENLLKFYDEILKNKDN